MILHILYKQFKPFFLSFKAIILRKVGTKYNSNGSDNEKPRLKNESLIAIICVLLYTAQKQEI